MDGRWSGGVTVEVAEGTHTHTHTHTHTESGRNVITRDLLSMSSGLPLDCESDYRGV